MSKVKLITEFLVTDIIQAIKKSATIYIMTSFVMNSGVKLLEKSLKEALDRGAEVNVLAGDYLYVTQPEALKRLIAIDERINVRLWMSNGTSFHPKAYLFQEEDGKGTLIVGSSNLSASALTKGVEWNIAMDAEVAPEMFEEAITEFLKLYHHEQTMPVNIESIAVYDTAYEKAHQNIPELYHNWTAAEETEIMFAEVEKEDSQIIFDASETYDVISPRQAQAEALESLETTIEEEYEKAMVVMATGLGKTYLAAFFARQFKRVLFIAHREEILYQAQASFQKILVDRSFGIYSGKEKTADADCIFASIFTLANKQHLEKFEPETFDLIVIDEFHHAAASTYQKAIQYFKPKFLLGITATPDRMDGKDIFAICDGNVAYQLHFLEAIQRGWLAPFHYYGVYDDTNYQELTWLGTRYAEEELLQVQLKQEMTEKIYAAWNEHKQTRTIGFCSSIKQAFFLENYFKSKGVRAISLHSKAININRRDAIKQLDQGELELIFTVDLFNEGVDIPYNLNKKNHITHASFINGDLTPTEATKQLKDFSAGKYFFLIISPERFQLKRFREELSSVNRTKAISLAVIDEVHCLSEWGHEFRTSYLALANSIRKFAPSSRFLALTATASSKVLKDIMTELQIESNNVITISKFSREELIFNIIQVNKKAKQEYLFEYLRHAGKNVSIRNDKGAILVFTPNVNGAAGCFQLSHSIQDTTGLATGFYSGSIPDEWGSNSNSFTKFKDDIQQSFMDDKLDVLVATKAFGMGIDKENIRQTIHYGIPSSLESFYQEAGRAGRDGKKSDCLVLYSPDKLNDAKLQTIFGVKTNLSMLEKEKGKMTGDLNSLLFFLIKNLKDIEVEVEEIYTFYQSNLNNDNLEIVLDYYKNSEQELKEKSIYRLALLGIVEDWTMNWKSRQIEVELVNWTEQSVIDKLTNHIQKYDYMFTLDQSERQSEHYTDLIEHFHGSGDPFLKRILFVLLKWYNDNVIYSRKRSILLMKQYADEFTDSESLQQKIETYFKRNDDVYLLESIVTKKDRLKDWFKIFYVEEEGKDDQPRALSTFKSLKITVSRFLESYNNDISLNLINGMMSLAEGNFDSIDGRDRMALAIREIAKPDSEVRQEMLTSILETSDIFLTIDQRSQLSEVLISNGYELMDDLKQIHKSLEDKFSYGSMVKTLHSTIKENSFGGYPWEI